MASRERDDRVDAALARQAAALGVSVPELLRRNAARLAARPSLDELRGAWPGAVPHGVPG